MATKKKAEPTNSERDVAARSGPGTPEDGKFRRTFTLSARGFDEHADNAEMHTANGLATLQAALAQGVHPKGDPYLDRMERTEDGSMVLTYAVESVPAGNDREPADTRTPSSGLNKTE